MEERRNKRLKMTERLQDTSAELQDSAGPGPSSSGAQELGAFEKLGIQYSGKQLGNENCDDVLNVLGNLRDSGALVLLALAAGVLSENAVRCHYAVGDDVLIKPANPGEMPYVARIKSILQGPQGIMVDVAWYYRPEEVKGGRKCYHGEKELLLVSPLAFFVRTGLLCRFHDIGTGLIHCRQRKSKSQAKRDVRARERGSPSVNHEIQ